VQIILDRLLDEPDIALVTITTPEMIDAIAPAILNRPDFRGGRLA